MEKGAGGSSEGLWAHSMLLQQGDTLPPGARIVSVTELARLGVSVSSEATINPPPQQRVSVLTNDTLQRLLASQPKPVVQSVLASPTGSRDDDQVEFSRPQQVIARPSPHFTQQLEEVTRVTSLQDSRLVGVPTMGRVIQMSELNRLALPEMKIVLQCDQKLEELDTLDLPISQSQQISSYMSRPSASLTEIDPEKKQEPAVEELMLLPLPTSAASPTLEPALIELVGQSLPHNLPTPPPLPPISQGGGIQNKVADRTFPAILTEELVAEYRTATRYDTIWKCQGGRYKVHKLVLALSSPLLSALLSCQEGEGVRPVIYTPDISSLAVKAILCLFYTGKVNVARGKIGEVNAALKMLNFIGNNVTVLPSQELIKQEIVPEYDISSSSMLVELEKGVVVELDKSGLSSKTPAGERVKVEGARDEESDEEWNIDTAFDPDLQGEADSDDDWWEAESKRMTKKRKLSNVKNERWSDDEEDGKTYSGFKRGRKSLKCPDTHEMFRTRGSGKGERSFQLALDLFDGRHVDFIYVCHGCYAIFDTFKKLALHKDDAHPENPDEYGPHHTSSVTQYNCPKCSQVIKVKHIAWFCKHLRFCRENNDIANAIVGPGDDSDEDENVFSGGRRKYNKTRAETIEASHIYMKDTEERLRITGEAKGRNVQTLSKILIGRVVDYIWACNVCYSVHLTEEELTRHKTTHHVEDGEKAGKYWNANSDNYTCPHCEQVQNSRHVIWFIYHMRKCNMSNVPMLKKDVNEEEDTEDEEERDGDDHDPEQIVLKTLNIRSERSEWLSESLLGKIVERVYCCHVCYSAYQSADELRKHFRPAHGELPNRIKNGAYYNAEKLGFECPSCRKVVCKKQNNSIFFIYHLRRCSGQALQLEKPCPECGKVFSNYPDFKAHIENHKALRSFMCHVCTKVFPSNARLNYHVQYVHSAYKPFPCTKCSKAYKRKAELLEHEEMSHSTHFNYSCDKCGKQFYGKKNLALHMKTHYTDEEKKHVCTVCGYRFAKIKFLKNHMTTHSDIRQYACEVKSIHLHHSKILILSGITHPDQRLDSLMKITTICLRSVELV